MKSLLATASFCLFMSLSVAHASDLSGRKVLMTADFTKSIGVVSIDGQDTTQKDSCTLDFYKANPGENPWESAPDMTFEKGTVFTVVKSTSEVSAFNGLFTVYTGETIVELMPLKDANNVGVKIECHTENYFTATGAKLNTKNEKRALKVFRGLQLL